MVMHVWVKIGLFRYKCKLCGRKVFRPYNPDPKIIITDMIGAKPIKWCDDNK